MLVVTSASAQPCLNTCTQQVDCETTCYTCQYLYPDGECPPEETTWKTCGDFSSGTATYDMVQWMTQTYAGHATSYLGMSSGLGPISDFSHHDSVNKRFYRINGANGNYNELFEYDQNYIYIRREATDVAAGNYLQHPWFIWTRRFATTGSHCGTVVFADSSYSRVESCSPTGSGGPNFKWTVSGPETLALGGDVGTVQALRLTQENLANPSVIERYYYAIPYGFAFYQRLVHGVVSYQENLNTIWSPAPPLLMPCSLPY